MPQNREWCASTALSKEVKKGKRQPSNCTQLLKQILFLTMGAHFSARLPLVLVKQNLSQKTKIFANLALAQILLFVLLHTSNVSLLHPSDRNLAWAQNTPRCILAGKPSWEGRSCLLEKRGWASHVWYSPITLLFILGIETFMQMLGLDSFDFSHLKGRCVISVFHLLSVLRWTRADSEILQVKELPLQVPFPHPQLRDALDNELWQKSSLKLWVM